jgi:hypothetical protein
LHAAANIMNKNPLNKGVLTENAIGIGTVTPAMVEARARELAVIAGRVPPQPSQVDYEQAKRELTGEPEMDLQEAALELIPESEGWDPVPGSTGSHTRTRLAKTRTAKDGARVRSLSKKESKRQSTIRCSKQPAPPRKRTNANRERESY